MRTDQEKTRPVLKDSGEPTAADSRDGRESKNGKGEPEPGTDVDAQHAEAAPSTREQPAAAAEPTEEATGPTDEAARKAEGGGPADAAETGQPGSAERESQAADPETAASGDLQQQAAGPETVGPADRQQRPAGPETAVAGDRERQDAAPKIRTESDVRAALAAWAGSDVGGVTPEEGLRRGYRPSGEPQKPKTQETRAPAPRDGEARPRRPAKELGPPQPGRIRWFDEEKGYGFIRPEEGDTDVFVHVTQFRERPENVKAGTRVRFRLGAGRGGKPEARQVELE